MVIVMVLTCSPKLGEVLINSMVEKEVNPQSNHRAFGWTFGA